MELILDLKNTPLYKAIEIEKKYLFDWDKKFQKIAKYLTFLFLLGSLLAFFQFPLLFQKFLGATFIFLSLWFFFFIKNQFFIGKIKRAKIEQSLEEAVANPLDYNFARFFDFQLAKAVFFTEELSKKKKFPFSPATFIKGLILKKEAFISFLISRLTVEEKFEDLIDEYLLRTHLKDISLEEVVFWAAKKALKAGKERISLAEMIIASFEKSPLLKRVLIDLEIKERDIANLVSLYEALEKEIEKRKKFWEYENLKKLGTIGASFAAGYTYYLDQFSFDLTKEVKRWLLKEIIGHKNEIERVERILSRKRINNVLLVGNPGVGRKSVIEAIALKCYKGDISPILAPFRVIDFDLTSLLASCETPEKTQIMLEEVFEEVKNAGNVILVIEEIHNFVGIEERRPGVVDIVPILSRYLRLSNFRVIATTTYSNLHLRLEQYPGFLNLFEKVEVSEISQEETHQVLLRSALEKEKEFKVLVSYPALREIIELTDKYFPTIPFPKKALDILDEAFVLAKKEKKKIITLEDIDKLLTEKTKIPIGKVKEREKKVLLNLEKIIHQRVVNQDEAISWISSALRRARSGVSAERRRPIGTFLFLGPTGVGKTETAKTLAEAYFGKEERMIRLDMSEFQRIEDIPRLLGKPGLEGLLTTKVKEHPFSLILLDEIEKAHPNILNLFLQVFDEGWITDGTGKKVIFTNNIIIGTSNAGASLIWEEIAEKRRLEIIKENLVSYLLRKGIFRPEFINRLDAVVVFRPLTIENLLDIAHLMLNKLKRNLKEKGIEFIITEKLKDKIVKLSYRPEFGAREMRRVISETVEEALARAILKGTLKRGQKVKINPEDFSLIIS